MINIKEGKELFPLLLYTEKGSANQNFINDKKSLLAYSLMFIILYLKYKYLQILFNFCIILLKIITTIIPVRAPQLSIITSLNSHERPGTKY